MKHALGLHCLGRRLPVRPDDILLASYPQSGNTWMRFLIANLVYLDWVVDLSNLDRLIVDPDVTPKRDIDRAPEPRIVKTHGSFDPRYRRIIYLVRDPRDVALAQYHHMRQSRRISNDVALEEFIERFVKRDLNRHVGSWGENVGSWLATRSSYQRFLIVRYEDMLADTARELSRVADFIGCPSTPEGILQSVELSSLDKMREREENQGESYLPIESPKSNWQKSLPQPLVARIEAAWGDIMTCLGYELVTLDADSALRSSLMGLLGPAAAGSLGPHENIPVHDKSASALIRQWRAVQ
jgi:hypothetical protein